MSIYAGSAKPVQGSLPTPKILLMVPDSKQSKSCSQHPIWCFVCKQQCSKHSSYRTVSTMSKKCADKYFSTTSADDEATRVVEGSPSVAISPIMDRHTRRLLSVFDAQHHKLTTLDLSCSPTSREKYLTGQFRIFFRGQRD